MKIPSKQELKQIAFNHLLGTDFTEFMNLCKKYTAKGDCFLVNDTALALDNSLCFRRHLFERIFKLIMTVKDKIRDEKLQYNINKKTAKTSALASVKIDKYEYFTCEEISLSDQGRMIEQTKFTYSLLGKALEK